MNALQDLTLVVVGFTMAPALAHALELPGKMRLTRDVYVQVQRIYYPGFTIAGFGGPASILLTAVQLWLVPYRTGAFWLALIALCGLVGMEIVYWIVIHPVNQEWVRDLPLSAAASGFFDVGHRNASSESHPPEWTELRNRWEYAHAVRAGLALGSFVALVIGHDS